MKRLCALLVSLILACGGNSLGSTSSAVRTKKSTPYPIWNYQISINSDLDEAEITACFGKDVGDYLVPPNRQAIARLLGAWDTKGKALPISRGRIQLGSNHCLRYRTIISQSGFFDTHWRSKQNLCFSTASWLWRPESWTGPRRAILQPVGKIPIIGPWEKTKKGYLLEANTFRFVSYLGAGNVVSFRSKVHDVQLDIHPLGQLMASANTIETWLARSLRSALQLRPFTRLESVHFYLVPVPTARNEVLFGMVGRGGAASVVLLVSPTLTSKVLERDWVATHELTHLMLPYVQKNSMWFSEGLATYFQEILRAKSGVISPKAAWSNIASGFRHGKANGTGRTLVQETKDAHKTYAFRRVYWSGAALALHAEIELRKVNQTSGGLPQNLLKVPACCGSEDKPWTAISLAEALDLGLSTPIWKPWISRHLNDTNFPPAIDLLEELGIFVQDREISFNHAKYEHLREAITAPPTQ